jgi:formate hydrogenlyase subunit 3/multisubunit Na+/H+ antiporter MnhD subunit
MMHPILYPIIVPIVLGTLCFLIPKKVKTVREVLALIGSTMVFGFTIWFFIQKPTELVVYDLLLLRLDHLSSFILLASGLFGLLITIYSIGFMKESQYLSLYYGVLLWTIGATCGALLANHLIVLLVFWGFLAITLYLLVLTGGEQAGEAAKKTLFIVGGSDALILFAIVLIYQITQSFELDKMNLPLKFDGLWVYVAFFCLALGAFAKAGAIPLHTWIPDVAEKAPIPVSAYLPAALDKLLGIYLLGRMGLHIFEMSKVANYFLMFIGAVTILAAVMMALIQHDLRKLLAYHAVSQVGYMVLGIGTGNPIGIAGGLFHMLNHSIYKSCLFLSGGAVQHRTKITDLDRLGGLGKLMPVTFITFIIAAFSISGVPPFNGFFSKWMIYQGLVEWGRMGDKIWIVWLVAAMFGSGLTLASFMKILHTVFLGIPSKDVMNDKKIKEVGLGMVTPMVILALLCVLFGLFAYTGPVKLFLEPSVSDLPSLSQDYPGFWSPGTATIMILLGLVLGLFIYYVVGNFKGVREAEHFIGGESLKVEERVTGTSFYQTIQNMVGIRSIYRWAEQKWFDIYDQLDRFASTTTLIFRRLHTGVLSMYLSWAFLGIMIILSLWIWR